MAAYAPKPSLDHDLLLPRAVKRLPDFFRRKRSCRRYLVLARGPRDEGEGAKNVPIDGLSSLSCAR